MRESITAAIRNSPGIGQFVFLFSSRTGWGSFGGEKRPAVAEKIFADVFLFRGESVFVIFAWPDFPLMNHKMWAGVEVYKSVSLLWGADFSWPWIFRFREKNGRGSLIISSFSISTSPYPGRYNRRFISISSCIKTFFCY